MTLFSGFAISLVVAGYFITARENPTNESQSNHGQAATVTPSGQGGLQPFIENVAKNAGEALDLTAPISESTDFGTAATPSDCQLAANPDFPSQGTPASVPASSIQPTPASILEDVATLRTSVTSAGSLPAVREVEGSIGQVFVAGEIEKIALVSEGLIGEQNGSAVETIVDAPVEGKKASAYTTLDNSHGSVDVAPAHQASETVVVFELDRPVEDEAEASHESAAATESHENLVDLVASEGGQPVREESETVDENAAGTDDQEVPEDVAALEVDQSVGEDSETLDERVTTPNGLEASEDLMASEVGQPIVVESQTPDATVMTVDGQESSEDAVAPTPPSADVSTVETFRERFPNGALKIEREVTLDADFNYIGHGIYRRWSEQGALIAEGRFQKGRQVGEWKRAYAADEKPLFSRPPFKLFEGPFISTATFRNGQLHGTWTIHDSQDRVASQIEFVDGVRNGHLRYFYPNGSKMREIDFRNGVVDGYLREFNDAGEVTLEHKYLDGRYCSVKVEQFVSTTKKSETNLLHPRMTIKTADDWRNAQLAEYGIEAGEPMRHGVQTVWHDNGQMRFRGQFEFDKATGEFVWYQENGQISRQGQYADGKQQGPWSWWHTNGTKSVSGNYDNGVPVGRWLFWKPDGDLDQVKELSDTERRPSDGVPVHEPSYDVQPLLERSA